MAFRGVPSRSGLLPLLLLALSSARGAGASPLRKAALYSSAAYCPSGAIRPGGFSGAACNSLSVSGARVFQGSVTRCPQLWGRKPPHAFVTTDHSLQSIVVAFMGTDAANPSDVLLDLTIFPTRCRAADNTPPLPGVVHEGFCCYFRSLVRAGLTQEVQKRLAQHPGYGVLTTGHSLGGAAAQLAGLDLALWLKPKSTQVFTFGSPRTGDNAFNAALAAHTTGANVVQAGDMVTKVPPGWPATIRQDSVAEAWACQAPWGIRLPSNLNICQGLLTHLYYLGMDVVNECCHASGPTTTWKRRCEGAPTRCRRVRMGRLSLADARGERSQNGTVVEPSMPGAGNSTDSQSLLFP